MRWLVTGGAGFIGSNFIRLALKQNKGLEIVNLDKLTYAGNLENLKDIEKDKRYTFMIGDICDPKAVGKAIKGCDTVINFAAESHVDRSIVNPGSFIQTDVFGTYVLLEASRKEDVDLFLHISTDEVYGSIETGLFRETDPLEPNSPYSASKAGAEMIVRSFAKTYGMKTIVTRSSNNYGPYQYPEKLIPLFVTNLIQGKKVGVYGDGLNVRDWIYVEDNCAALLFLVKNGTPGEIYNIGGGNERTNIEITKFILRHLEKGEDMINYVKDRPGHDRRYALDSTKLLSMGFKYKYSFEEAMKKTVDWYVNNPKWWEHCINKKREFDFTKQKV